MYFIVFLNRTAERLLFMLQFILAAITFLAMSEESLTTPKKKMGRPRKLVDPERITISIPRVDYDLLMEIADYTGNRPVDTIRELISENRPVLNAICEAMKAAKSGDITSAFTVLAKAGGESVEALMHAAADFDLKK